MNSYEKYTEYFENLAVKHTGLYHDPSNKKKGFFKINIEEVLTGVRSDVKADGYYLVLTNYLWTPITKGAETLNEIQCMFFVLGTAKEKDFVQNTEVLNNTEVICKDLINRISFDSKTSDNKSDSFFYGSQDTIKIESVVPVTWVTSNQSMGWQVTLTFYPKYNSCVDHTKWSDIDSAYDADPNNY